MFNRIDRLLERSIPSLEYFRGTLSLERCILFGLFSVQMVAGYNLLQGPLSLKGIAFVFASAGIFAGYCVLRHLLHKFDLISCPWISEGQIN